MNLSGTTTEVETLRKALSVAEDKVAKERIEREKQEARVGEVQQELEALAKKHESLELDSKTRESKLAQALESVRGAKAEAHKALQEIDAAKKIATGKAFNMQSKNVNKKYLVLTQIQSSPGDFVDLPRSVTDTAEFFRAEEGGSTEKLFWSQYLAPEHPMPFNGQLK